MAIKMRILHASGKKKIVNIANAIKETTESYDVPVVGLALDPSCQIKADGTLVSGKRKRNKGSFGNTTVPSGIA